MEFTNPTDLILALAFAGVAFGLGILAVWLATREIMTGKAMVLLIHDRNSYRARVDQLIGLNREYETQIVSLKDQVALFDQDGDGKVGGSKRARA